jgi:hypothetical protein
MGWTILTVAQDEDYCEALYVDGDLRANETTIFSSEIAQFAGDDPIVFRFVHAEGSIEEWPSRLEDLKLTD